MRLAVLAALGAVLSLSGCDTCKAGEMRCSGSAAQMCNENDDWETWQDCGSIGQTCSTAASACSGYTDIACCN